MNSVMFLYQPVMTELSIPADGKLKTEQYIFIVFFVSGIGSMMGGTAAGKLCEKFSRIHVAYAMLFLAIAGNNFSTARLFIYINIVSS